MIKIKKGLDLPITGAPVQKIEKGNSVTKVALIGDDIVGMKPSMQVQVGDQVQIGQVLYQDKKQEGINYTSPAAGEVVEILRGEKRAFQSVVIKCAADSYVDFKQYKGADLSSYNKEELIAFLIESGAWTSLRTRPFSKVADPSKTPNAIFVTAVDSHPLAADPRIVISQRKADFEKGLKLLSKLSPKTFVCTDGEEKLISSDIENTEEHAFSGPHPSGLVGTHIHHLSPVGRKNFVWHLNYQEVIALGYLLENGKLDIHRVISLAGPVVKNPRLIKTRVGACASELAKDELNCQDEVRIVSGSLFGGRHAIGAFDYLGKFHHQLSIIREGRDREFLGWHRPGLNQFSIKPIYLSKLIPKKLFNFTSNANGSLRSIVPIGSYEKVMPLDIQATYLVRSIMCGNLDMCVDLGALELDEEDLSLCTFVDPCKNDFAVKLRENLTIIEKEG